MLVVFVPVAFVHEMFVKKDGDVEETKRLLTARFVKEPFVEVTPVKEALVAKRLVEVTLEAEMFPAVSVVIVPDVEFKFVTVPFVEVRFVIVPFVVKKLVVETLLDVRAAMKLFAAFIVVPEATLKPNHEVEVPFVKSRFEMVPFVDVRFVKFAFVP